MIQRGDLLAQAKGKGKVRVIVTFGVPGLETKQRASRLLRVVPSGTKRFSPDLDAVRKADADLAETIRRSSADLFAGLRLDDAITHVFQTVPQAVLVVDYDGLLALEDSPRVTRVVEDRLTPAPDPPSVSTTRKLHAVGSYGVNIINAPQAWARGYDGAGWYVAVLDTGVRTSHEMFAGKYIVEACFSTTWGTFSSSLCPGEVPEAEGPGSAVPPDRFGHGTHVSGIAVGNQPGGDQKGVAPAAGLIAIQVFSYIPSWGDIGSYSSDQIKGLEYVYGLRATYRIASANMSLGDSGSHSSYCDSDARRPAIENLRAAGIAVTIAGGNDGYCGGVNAPACVSSAVAVGASNFFDDPYHWNNWHPVMQDIFAPGVSIYSADSWSDTYYSTRSGTSMAAPHVAGAWAIFRQAAPIATVDEIEEAMKISGVIIESGCETEPSSGPRLNVSATLAYLLTTFPVPTLSGWGMIIFAALVAGAAIVFMRKKDGMSV